MAKMENPHCSSCGDDNPETNEGDGYTVCCNEPACTSQVKNRYGVHGNNQKSVVACCWGKAERIMASKGIEEEYGMCRW